MSKPSVPSRIIVPFVPHLFNTSALTLSEGLINEVVSLTQQKIELYSYDDYICKKYLPVWHRTWKILSFNVPYDSIVTQFHSNLKDIVAEEANYS